MASPPPLPPPFPPVPPPLPQPVSHTKPRSYVVGVLIAGFVVLCVAVLGIIVLGAAASRQRQAARESFEEAQRISAEARLKMDEANKKGDPASGFAAVDSAIEKVKQGNKSTSSDPGDAANARGMTNFETKMQLWLREYSSAAITLKKANILGGEIHDRVTIEQDRQIVRDFLAANARLLELALHTEDMMRAELDAEHVPVSKREASVAGFLSAQTGMRPVGIQMRRCGQTIGESILSVLDLFDQHWGQWQYDDKTGQIRFQDNETRDAYNALLEKIRATTVEQAKLQEQATAQAKAVLKR